MNSLETEAAWTVGEVAALTGVSIRALRHYDDIGLLRPAARSEGNYRLYTPADLARLHRVLTFRELGFPLSEIARLLGGDPDTEQEALRLQITLLRERQRRTQAMLDAALAFLRETDTNGNTGGPMSDDTIRDVFGGFDPSTYEPEVQERWGESAAYRQSAERTRRYRKADWEAVRAEADALNARYLALMNAGLEPDSPQAAEVVGQHRAHIERWFYDCSPQMLRGVSELWVSDERFTRNIDRAGTGLAAYQHAAVQAWAAGQEEGQQEEAGA